jgi:hypothetical protein
MRVHAILSDLLADRNFPLAYNADGEVWRRPDRMAQFSGLVECTASALIAHHPCAARVPAAMPLTGKRSQGGFALERAEGTGQKPQTCWGRRWSGGIAVRKFDRFRFRRVLA